MQIKKVAEKTGISQYTIRFYEQYGLIDKELIHRLPNNYRDYDEKVVQILESIKFGQAIGFTLSEMRIVIGRISASRIHDDKKIEMLKAKLEELGDRRKAIDNMCKLIKDKISKLEMA